jgi:hypothetical protein
MYLQAATLKVLHARRPHNGHPARERSSTGLLSVLARVRVRCLLTTLQRVDFPRALGCRVLWGSVSRDAGVSQVSPPVW